MQEVWTVEWQHILWSPNFEYFAIFLFISLLFYFMLNLWCKRSGLLSDNIFSGVPTLSINQVTFAQTSHKKNLKRERSRASKLNIFMNNQTTKSKKKRKKQDHLRMNNSTGSNNHLQSKHLCRSMIINKSKVRDDVELKFLKILN